MSLVLNQTGQQNMLAAAVASRAMGNFKQQLNETISYGVDYAAWLGAGESLASVTITVTPSTGTPPTILNKETVNNGTAIQFQLSGGDSGQYEIALSAVTSTGQTKRDFFYVWVGEVSPKVALLQLEQATRPTLALSQLTDVAVTDGIGIDGYSLVWSQMTGKWVAQAPATPPSAGPTHLHQLADVLVSEDAAIDGYSLVWSQAARRWVAGSLISQLGYTPANVALNLSDLTNKAVARGNLGLAAVAASGSASDLGTGTLPADRLPAPTSSTLGGVKSLAAVSHQFLTSIGNDGLPAAAQPAFTDISGQVATAQIADGAVSNDKLAGIVPVAKGGTGTATPGLVAGANVTITGVWPNQTVAAAGGAPGGVNGQIQYNASGSFGGFTVGGDGTLDTATGALVVTKSNGVAFGSAAFAATGAFDAAGTASAAVTSFAATLGTLAYASTINNANWSGTPLAVANGGTGTATPGLVAGTNVTITGVWPNQTINASGGGGTPGGSNGQVQYNNSGAFGGFTVGGDATLNTGTGALTVTKTGGVAFGSFATVTPTGTPTGAKFLRDDNSWAVPAGGSGSPGGTSGQYQYNNSGSFGGIGLILFADTTFYVDPTGNDANDGSIGSPWATPQHAADVMGTIDANTYSVIVQINDGTYSAGGGVDVMAVMNRPHNAKFFGIYGNGTTPGNVVFDGVDQSAFGICLGFRSDVFALNAGVIVDEIYGIRYKNCARSYNGANFSGNIFMHDVESEDCIVDFWTESWASLYLENSLLIGARSSIAVTKAFANSYIFGLGGDTGATFSAEAFRLQDTSISFIDSPDYTNITASGGATQWFVDAFCKLDTGGVSVPGAAGTTDTLGKVI